MPTRDIYLDNRQNERLLRRTLVTSPYYAQPINRLLHTSPELLQLYDLYTQTQHLKILLQDSSWSVQQNLIDSCFTDVSTRHLDIQEHMEDSIFTLMEKVFEELGDIGCLEGPVEQEDEEDIIPLSPPLRDVLRPQRHDTPHPRVPLETLTTSSSDKEF
jgi:hypothetical protein